MHMNSQVIITVTNLAVYAMHTCKEILRIFWFLFFYFFLKFQKVDGDLLHFLMTGYNVQAGL